jgi:hypothetical protein
MFSVREKREISEKVQQILRATPRGEKRIASAYVNIYAV